MSTIRFNCPLDGLPADVSPDVAVMYRETREYGFTCPKCALFHTKPMDERIEALLNSVGVRYFEPQAERPVTPLLTADEVTDFAITIHTASDEAIAEELGL